MPEPVVSGGGSKLGIIAFGSTVNAIEEARVRLAEAGLEVDFLRVRAIPLGDAVTGFVKAHERVYVVEMNRDGQLYDMLRLHVPADQVAKLSSIRRYDGQPIPAEAISRPILELEAVPAS
jgi:2-oxoglutarate/2-oxoacid ferredoxin oxidoreductase subunit alpha